MEGYFNITDHNYSLPGRHVNDDIETVTDSNVKWWPRELLNHWRGFNQNYTNISHSLGTKRPGFEVLRSMVKVAETAIVPHRYPSIVLRRLF